MGTAAVATTFEATNQTIQLEYCRILHERLTARAKQRIALEAEEARDLVYAEEAGMWRHFGYVSMQEYMERALHYGPHAARERLRVANELFELPRLAEKFRAGELPYSVVREVTRVAVPETEEAWLASTEGKTAREVERMVSGLPRGADPDARPDPKLVRHRIVLDVDGERYAKWRARRTACDDDRGERLSDDDLVDVLVREPGGDGTSAPCLHAVTTCRICKTSALVAGGIETPLSDNARDRLLCDAARVGDLERDDMTRRTSDIPSATRRRVFIRDRFACAVPGCRAARNLDLHHVIWRTRGGTHAMSNLVVLCSGHHGLVHDGLLELTGVAPDRLVFTFRRLGDDEPHLVLTTEPARFEPAGEEDSVPRGTESEPAHDGS